jgi:hypothetical protein
MHTARGAASRAVRAPPAVGMWPRSPPAGLALRGLRTQAAAARGAGCHMRVLGAPPALRAPGVCGTSDFFVCPHTRAHLRIPSTRLCHRVHYT